jgi:maltoporin
MAAGYLRFFRDGSPAPSSREKYDEGALIARPQVYLGEHWGVGLEGSFQQRRYGFVDASKDENVKASLLRAAINPYFSPAGRGSFKRPQLGLVYMITSRDQGARSLYASEDVFSRRKAEHFFGLLAEWWFNFSSYP